MSRHLPFYGSHAWRVIAADQLRLYPTCAHCGAWADVADHVVPHRGDRLAFLFGELVSLCRDCHRQRVAERRLNHDRR